MLQTEAEHHVRRWPVWESRVYYYRGAYPWFKEIVVLMRKHPGISSDPKEFECVKMSSTVFLDAMDEEDILRMLQAGILVFKEEFDAFKDYKLEKTGGCDCGSWAVPAFAGLHDRTCKVYKKR